MRQEHLAGSEKVPHNTHASHQRSFDHGEGTAEFNAGFLGIGPKEHNVRYGVWEGVKQMGSAATGSIAGIRHLFSPSGLSNYVDNFTSPTNKLYA